MHVNVGVQEARASAFWWGKWSPPIRNSILQYWEDTEATVETLYHPEGTSKVSCKCDFSKVPDYNGGLWEIPFDTLKII